MDDLPQLVVVDSMLTAQQPDRLQDVVQDDLLVGVELVMTVLAGASESASVATAACAAIAATARTQPARPGSFGGDRSRAPGTKCRVEASGLGRPCA